MNHSVNIHIQQPAAISAALPEQFKVEWLPGSCALSASGNFGAIAVQSIKVQDIDIHYIVAEIQQELVCRVLNTAPSLFFIIQLKGSYEIVSKKGHSEFSKQNAFTVLFSTDSSMAAKLPKQEKVLSLILVFPVSLIISILSFHPFLDEWKEKIETKANFTSEEHALSVSLSENVYGLLHTPFVPLTQEYYLRTCKEIVEQIFSESAGHVGTSIPFDMHDIGCIHAAKQYLDTHILEHPTIVQLSRKAGINRLKLKKGFKALYGIGVYGYQLQQRLLIAKSALEKTKKPVHQVARQAGYKSTSNFSAAFKRVYGVSPYRYRHNQEQAE